MTITVNPPAIWRENKKFADLIGKKATIECFSRLHNNSKTVVAIVQLKGGDKKTPKKFTVQLCKEGLEKLKVGAEIMLVSRKFDTNENGLIKYTIKAKVL